MKNKSRDFCNVDQYMLKFAFKLLKLSNINLLIFIHIDFPMIIYIYAYIYKSLKKCLNLIYYFFKVTFLKI